MYYYITEPLTTSAEKKKIEDIKTILSQLGIAGEFAVASPARTVEEHLELAFKKGFTTIVGIGDDALANRVASTILQHQYEHTALGIIPLSSSQELWRMIGTSSIRQTCEFLRVRHLTPIDAIALNKNHSCITDASISLTKPVQFQLRWKNSLLSGSFTDLSIGYNGKVAIADTTYATQTETKSWLGRMFNQKEISPLAQTSFVANSWQFATEEPCPVAIAGKRATETPLSVKRRPEALKLIVNRARMTESSVPNQEPT